MKLCFDIDGVLFPAASIAQETFITATHKPTGLVQEFDNRTALWGHHSKKIGGFIGLQNEISGGDYYKAEDFIVEEGARLRPFRVKGKDGEPDTFIPPLEGAKLVITDKINEFVAKTMAEGYFGFTGENTVFRHELATLLPYKGNRTAPSPLLLKELKAWVCEEHNITMVHNLEADDACNIAMFDGYNKWIKGGKRDEDKVVQVSFDKDAKGCVGWLWNPDKNDAPYLIEGLGKLELNSKGDVDGYGRMWLYYQVGSGDSSDNYCANCFSDKKWGSKSAYKELVDCKTDKEALTALVSIFKKLYPEKKTVEGCKGSVEIDWLYVMQECFDMAFMLRHANTPRDRVHVQVLLDKLGVKY